MSINASAIAGPAKRVRWGILGTANIAEAAARGIRESRNGVLAAVASRSEARARVWAERHGIPRWFGSYEALLRSGEADAIYVPLPNSRHAEWTIRALEAGCAVLCEKPLAANAVEARAVAAAAARTGRPVAEAFMYRFHPQWDRAWALARGGAVGEISTLHAQFTFLLDDPTAICASAELAGGALMDVGCYCVDFARQVAGREPTRASAFARFDGVDRVMVGLLEFPGGLLAHFETGIANFERHRAEIAGAAGSIVLESPWVPGDQPAHLVVRRPDAAPEEMVAPPANSYRLEVEDFAAACRGEKAPRWPIADAVANMTAIDALYASAREGRTVAIPREA